VVALPNQEFEAGGKCRAGILGSRVLKHGRESSTGTRSLSSVVSDQVLPMSKNPTPYGEQKAPESKSTRRHVHRGAAGGQHIQHPAYLRPALHRRGGH